MTPGEPVVLVVNRDDVPSPFDDNVRGLTCSECGHGVYRRPHAPSTNVTYVCHVCYLRALHAGELDDVTIAITARTMRELQAFSIFGPPKRKGHE